MRNQARRLGHWLQYKEKRRILAVPSYPPFEKYRKIAPKNWSLEDLRQLRTCERKNEEQRKKGNQKT